MNLEDNFNTALELVKKPLDYEVLLEMLKSDSIVKKQLAALEINKIESEYDANILVSNLSGQDGKIREAVAFKLNELYKNTDFTAFFQSEMIFEKMLNGIMDINGNVCRLVVELAEDDKFSSYLAKKLPSVIKDILGKIRDLTEEEKKYVISKRNFQLYWSLEALSYCMDEIELTQILDILKECSDFDDYTIREKVAKIISKNNSAQLDNIKIKLKNDDNYYVNRYFS